MRVMLSRESIWMLARDSEASTTRTETRSTLLLLWLLPLLLLLVSDTVRTASLRMQTSGSMSTTCKGVCGHAGETTVVPVVYLQE
jgi:hypothetical protein